MQIRRPNELTGHAALDHASELTRRWFHIHLFGGVVVAEVRRKDMRVKSLFGETGEAARLAHMELDLRILRRHLHVASLGMVKEKPRNLLERIRDASGLDLADDASKIFLTGKNADFCFQRLDELALDESSPFRFRAAELAGTLPVTVERLSLLELSFVGETVPRRLWSVKAAWCATFARYTLLILIAKPAVPGLRHNPVARRPRRRKVERTESAKVYRLILSVIFRHDHSLLKRFCYFFTAGFASAGFSAGLASVFLMSTAFFSAAILSAAASAASKSEADLRFGS